MLSTILSTNLLLLAYSNKLYVGGHRVWPYDPKIIGSDLVSVVINSSFFQLSSSNSFRIKHFRLNENDSSYSKEGGATVVGFLLIITVFIHISCNACIHFIVFDLGLSKRATRPIS